MSTIPQGASGSTAHTGFRPALGQQTVGGNYPGPQQIPPEQSTSNEIKRLIDTASGTILSLRRSTRLTGQKESSVTKEEFGALVKSLNRLGLGMSGGDAGHGLQPTRSSALLITLERFKKKLQEVSDRIENTGYTGNNQDAEVVSQVMNEVQAAIADSQFPALPPNPTGELPPPAPKACFGRDDLVDEVVTLAESLTSVALIGVGGIGKTFIALKVLHDDRVKQRFGENRRFIRCDKFPATLSQLLDRLSKATGAGIDNPEDLTPLLPFLTSREMIIVLDNAESILDPEGADAGEIYDLVEELSELPTLCLCITSRISTIPHECKTMEVPVLSMDAACQAFYHIYKLEKESNLANEILEQLEFHPLSITLLATVGHQNKWRMERLKGEWDKRRTSVLQTRHKKSLAAVIELSLTSPMFQEFGPDARGLLGVVAFFPQGVDENNIDWLFPTISNRIDIFDGLCVLSLTSRSNGFITMLAPLRDYLSPDDPRLSPLLCAAKDRYFIRMSVYPDPDKSDSKEIRWIASEDANVEHLIDVFATIDANLDDIWEACDKFMAHLYWHTPRLTFLAPKIQWLPDNHCYKSGYLVELSMFLGSIGNDIECKKLLNRALKLEREQGSDVGVARILSHLCDASRHMGLYDEGAQQARDGLEIYESLGNQEGQAQCLIQLAWFSLEQEQLGAAEEAASRAMNLLPETGDQFLVCNSHHILGLIYRSKGEIEKAVHHLEAALAIASSFDWRGQLFDIHFSLATLFCDEGKLDSAHIHAERTKLYAVNNPYGLGKAMIQQAAVWWRQYKPEETRSEVLRAAEIFEKLGSSWGMRVCGEILEHIQKGRDGLIDSGQLGTERKR